MFKNRIASTAALATFGLAALGGIALAAPGNADTGATTSPGRTTTSAAGNQFDPATHDLFPTKPRGPHEGQGHKGDNEPSAFRP